MGNLNDLAALVRSIQSSDTASQILTRIEELPTIEAPQPTALSELEQIAGKIQDLQVKMQLAAPGYESLLYHIHKAIANNEELGILLSEEQIGVICTGLAKRKNIVIATSITAKKTSAKTAQDNL